jgi:hypothetical protein
MKSKGYAKAGPFVLDQRNVLFFNCIFQFKKNILERLYQALSNQIWEILTVCQTKEQMREGRDQKNKKLNTEGLKKLAPPYHVIAQGQGVPARIAQPKVYTGSLATGLWPWEPIH